MKKESVRNKALDILEATLPFLCKAVELSGILKKLDAFIQTKAPELLDRFLTVLGSIIRRLKGETVLNEVISIFEKHTQSEDLLIRRKTLKILEQINLEELSNSALEKIFILCLCAKKRTFGS